MVVLLVNVPPHHVEDGGADQAVLDRAGEQEGPGLVQQVEHHGDVVLAVFPHLVNQVLGLRKTFMEIIGGFRWFDASRGIGVDVCGVHAAMAVI